MDGGYETDEKFKIRLIIKNFTPSFTPLSHINFNFHIEFKISQFVLNQDSTTPQLIRQNDFPKVVSTSVTVQKFLFILKTRQALYEETREAINRVLFTLPLFDHDMCDQLIVYAWIEAWRGCFRSDTLCGGTDLDLHFLVQVEGSQILDPSLESMVNPATDSSEKYEIECCICLDDFSGRKGGAALCMQCKHVFHGDCIDKWLRTSHYCPLCRFELPRWRRARRISKVGA